MRLLLASLTLFASVVASAATVRITSFNYADTRSRVAELCGIVEGATTSPSMVRAVIDPRSKMPAVYNSVAGDDGNFCVIVITHTGLAEVSAFGGTVVLATVKK